MSWDVVIVGGGIAGISVAYELAESASVLLVEAEPMLARHTTGRSAAVYLPSYGGPAVRALTAASKARFDAFDVELLRPRPCLWLATDDEGEEALATTVGAGIAEPVGVADAVRLCPVLRPESLRSAAVDRSTMDVDAMGLHQAYVRGFAERGGEVRLGARVTGLAPGWRVTLGDEVVHAGLVVDAAGAWVDKVAELAGAPTLGARPLRRTIAVSPAEVDPGWPLVADAADTFYFRPEGQGVLLSPADETPSEPVDAKAEDIDVALALMRVNEVTTLGLRSVRTQWAGLRTFVADREPVVGFGAPGFAYYAGQGGYGIQMAPAAAAVAAAVFLGQAPPDDVRLDPAVLAPDRLW